MKYQNLLLDLDGTIINPIEGITKSIQYALDYMGVRVENADDLKVFIGPPLRETFKELYHFTDQQTELAVQKYRERYAVKGVFENTLYDGIPEFLRNAKQNGYRLMLATSKPTVFAVPILENFNLLQEFEFIGGAELDGSRDKKADVIRYVLQSTRIEDISATVMIGDRKHDIIGANEFGMDSIGVLYGFGTRNELEQAGATYIIDDVKKIEKII